MKRDVTNQVSSEIYSSVANVLIQETGNVQPIAFGVSFLHSQISIDNLVL